MVAPPLSRSSPSEQGVASSGLLAFLEAMEAASDIELHSLMVLRHGSVVAEGWWAPYTRERPHLLYSLSKSFTSTAAGFAVAEGLLDLDATVVSYFPELDADVTDRRSRAMLVRHIAAMASGHLAETQDRVLGADPAEPVRGFLMLPPERDPGSVFAYNQPCTYTLAAIIQRQSGQTLTDYLRPRLLDPLGIGDVGWQQHPAGRDIGFSGLHATTDAIARLGQLYLQGGQWEGRQLLSKEWVAEATRSHVSNAGEPEPDWQQGYGFQFWRSRHGVRGDGAYGQFCLVLPEYDAVVATTAATENMQGILDAVWEHLLPALGADDLPDADDRLSAARDATLAERLAQVALPAFTARPLPQSLPTSDEQWSGATFTPAGGRCADQPSLTSVTLSSTRDGWHLVFEEPPGPLDVRLGMAGWAVTDGTDTDEAVPAEAVTDTATTDGANRLPVAASGGWTDADTLHAEVLFLETPHRLLVDLSLPERTFHARWQTYPLSGGWLRSLRSPRRAHATR